MIQVFQVQFPNQNMPILTPSGVMTNQGMSFLRALYDRTGQGTGLVNQVDDSVAAAGTTSADAAAITTDWINVTSRSSGANGVLLPALTGGQMVAVFNNAGGNVIVYPQSGATIDGGTSYTLATGKMQMFWFVSSSQILSTQLG